MAVYNAVGASEKDADSPLTVSLIDKLDQNPHAIAQGAVGAPRIQTAAYNDASVTNPKLGPDSVMASKIASDAVGQSEIAAAAVGQAELKTGTTSDSQALNADELHEFSFAHGEYIFSPELYCSSINGYKVITDSSGTPKFDNTSYQGVFIMVAPVANSTMFARCRYVQASPPHKIGTLDYDSFIYLKLNSAGDVVGVSISDDPPWYYRGPTNIKADRVDKKGKKYKNVIDLPEDFDTLTKLEKIKVRANANRKEILITPEFKNKDMVLFPHPFKRKKATDSIILIEPDDKVYSALVQLHKEGENVNEAIHDGFLKINTTETVLSDSQKPPGVPVHKMRWKTG